MLELGLETLRRKTGLSFYKLLDRLYVGQDRQHVRRTQNIRLIPPANSRRGGKLSYAEWAHVVGIFQTLLYLHLDKKEDNVVLDIGCGTGILEIASEPFLGKNGRYVGLDVSEKDINQCKRLYPDEKFSFIHFDVHNSTYARSQTKAQAKWDIEDDSVDAVTALSVWTHFNEKDANFYLAEVQRVLKPGGKAIVTLFLMDEVYEQSLGRREDRPGRFHNTRQDRWVFDRPAYGSAEWYCPDWVGVPEDAIGIRPSGLARMLVESRLNQITHYPGNWKEVPGVFFQDVIVLQTN